MLVSDGRFCISLVVLGRIGLCFVVLWSEIVLCFRIMGMDMVLLISLGVVIRCNGLLTGASVCNLLLAIPRLWNCCVAMNM